ncbi:MAG TPA: hypothetical protein PKI20_20560 [Verrucomicrobiota bacterium]|nr:hypothetical protein [Verrucomicrobiota bacterium]HQL80165.1 hypothetical protein [Verrucomicrobiota bacterium]
MHLNTVLKSGKATPIPQCFANWAFGIRTVSRCTLAGELAASRFDGLLIASGGKRCVGELVRARFLPGRSGERRRHQVVLVYEIELFRTESMADEGVEAFGLDSS